MRRWSSGLEARRLGLGVEGVIPSAPDRPLVLHGEQSLPMLSRILQKQATQEDLVAAVQLAKQNENLDEFVKGALAAGRGYAEPQPTTQRMAGTALLGSGAGATALYLTMPEEEQQVLMEVM